MSNKPQTEDLDHFLMLIYREVEKDPLEGLAIWSARFADYRKQGKFDLCETLLDFAKGLPLPVYAQGVVHYSEGWLKVTGKTPLLPTTNPYPVSTPKEWMKPIRKFGATSAPSTKIKGF